MRVGSDFSGVVSAPALSGSLTRLQDGTSYLREGENITIVSSSAGHITISSSDTDTTYISSDFNHNQLSSYSSAEHIDWTQTSNSTIHTSNYTDTNTTYTAGDGLDLAGTMLRLDLKPSGGLLIDTSELTVDNSIIATITGSRFTGTVTAPALSGSLTQLSDGSSYIRQGNNISIVSGSDGSITITALEQAGTGDADVQYLVSELSGSTPNAKLIEAGPGIKITTGSNQFKISADLTAVSARNKKGYFVTSSHPTNTDFSVHGSDFSDVSYDSNLIDVYLNGQLLLSGSSSDVASSAADYSIIASSSVRFSFGLDSSDHISAVISKLKDPTMVDFTTMQFVTFGSETSHANQRVLRAADGISISTANPQEIAISTNRSKKFFDITGSHAIAQPYDCHSMDFSSVNYNPDRIDVFLNGQSLRTGSAYDYVLQSTGSILFNSVLEQNDMVQVIIF